MKKNNLAAFVMPHKLNGSEVSERWLREAIKSIEDQTDPNWILIIIDDCSESEIALKELENIEHRFSRLYINSSEKLHIIRSKEKLGAGNARNLGIKYAAEIGSPFILYLDTDDIAHERRLELTRKVFDADPAVNVVYTSFDVIDENGNIYLYDNIPMTIREIIDGHKKDIVQGENAWINIAVKKNYTTLTSCTAVRTKLALEEPFPATSVSEDVHTWYRYGAHPGKYVFLDEIKNSYRVCSGADSRSRSENPDFYNQKVKIDSDGFEEAVKIYLRYNNNNNNSDKEIDFIRVGFLVREALCMIRVNENKIAEDLLKKAVFISDINTKKAVKELVASDQEKNMIFKIIE